MNYQSFIRNFSIISHIDHGKSTLADRFLEITGTVPKYKMKNQHLDTMDLEREKGITIKMQPVRMEFNNWVLNLIDTPGHVDFNYEVSRSLAAVEGAILLVDATKGLQAQTLANLELAKEQKLTIIPVVNKIDLAQAQIEETKIELSKLLKISVEDIFSISAKNGTNVEQLLEIVIKSVPKPSGDPTKILKALIFDLKYDPYKGIVAGVRIVDGKIKEHEFIYLLASQAKGKIKEIGFFKPDHLPQVELKAGEIGYIATGIKEPNHVRVGDTITIFNRIFSSSSSSSFLYPKPLPGYKEPNPMVFTGIYLEDGNQYHLLENALAKLKLDDASFTFKPETREFLGRGFLVGFLGALHAEIILERMRREFNLNLIITTPQVAYKTVDNRGVEKYLFTPQAFSDIPKSSKIEEPWVRLEIIFPKNFFGQVMAILEELSGHHLETKYLSIKTILMVYHVPLREIIVHFHHQLKGATQGFASMNYRFLDYREADLHKLEVLIAGKKEEIFARIVSKKKSYSEAKAIVKKIKEILPPQFFTIAIQAQVQGRIIARETIKAKRKDVLASIYAADKSRKSKLLNKQKRGKKKLQQTAAVRLSPKLCLEIFKI